MKTDARAGASSPPPGLPPAPKAPASAGTSLTVADASGLQRSGASPVETQITRPRSPGSPKGKQPQAPAGPGSAQQVDEDSLDEEAVDHRATLLATRQVRSVKEAKDALLPLLPLTQDDMADILLGLGELHRKGEVDSGSYLHFSRVLQSGEVNVSFEDIQEHLELVQRESAKLEEGLDEGLRKALLAGTAGQHEIRQAIEAAGVDMDALMRARSAVAGFGAQSAARNAREERAFQQRMLEVTTRPFVVPAARLGQAQPAREPENDPVQRGLAQFGEMAGFLWRMVTGQR